MPFWVYLPVMSTIGAWWCRSPPCSWVFEKWRPTWIRPCLIRFRWRHRVTPIPSSRTPTGSRKSRIAGKVIEDVWLLLISSSSESTIFEPLSPSIKVMKVRNITFLRPFNSKNLTKLAILHDYKQYMLCSAGQYRS